MDQSELFARYGLKFNPFPPAATGTAFAKDLWVPSSWSTELESVYTALSGGEEPKATTVVGGYGSGKTYVLHWMMEQQFRPNHVQPYYIGNPGLAFYTLADELLRQIGRYEFSKAVWQALSNEHGMFTNQSSFVESPFNLWLESLHTQTSKTEAQRRLATALQNLRLTDEAEVSFRFAQIIVGTKGPPPSSLFEILCLGHLPLSSQRTRKLAISVLSSESCSLLTAGKESHSWWTSSKTLLSVSAWPDDSPTNTRLHSDDYWTPLMRRDSGLPFLSPKKDWSKLGCWNRRFSIVLAVHSS